MTLFADWCAGYMTGVGLDREGWRSLLEARAPCLLHHHADVMAPRLAANAGAQPPSNAEHEARADALADEACAIRDYWFSLRVALSRRFAAPTWRRRRRRSLPLRRWQAYKHYGANWTQRLAQTEGKLRTRSPAYRQTSTHARNRLQRAKLRLQPPPRRASNARWCQTPPRRGRAQPGGQSHRPRRQPASPLKACCRAAPVRVDLIFIDPPYNTGNEGWCYSDNVNSPIMRRGGCTNPWTATNCSAARQVAVHDVAAPHAAARAAQRARLDLDHA